MMAPQNTDGAELDDERLYELWADAEEKLALKLGWGALRELGTVEDLEAIDLDPEAASLLLATDEKLAGKLGRRILVDINREAVRR